MNDTDREAAANALQAWCASQELRQGDAMTVMIMLMAHWIAQKPALAAIGTRELTCLLALEVRTRVGAL